MIEQKQKKDRKKNSTSAEVNPKIFSLIEELSWVLKRYSDIDMKSISKDIIKIQKSIKQHGDVEETTTDNRVKVFKILLPIFSQKEMFDQDKIFDIADNLVSEEFSEKELIKFSVIGRIVYELSNASEAKLEEMIKSLEEQNTHPSIQASNNNDTKRNWNETIQYLIEKK